MLFDLKSILFKSKVLNLGPRKENENEETKQKWNLHYLTALEIELNVGMTFFNLGNKKKFPIFNCR